MKEFLLPYGEEKLKAEIEDSRVIPDSASIPAGLFISLSLTYVLF